MEILNQTLVNVLSTVIVGGLTLLLIQAFSYLRSKTALIEDEQSRNIVNNVLNQTEELIKKNIIATDNVTKPILLEALKDGKIDKSELVTLKDKVKENVLNQMGEDGLDILNNTIKDVDSYIETLIESKLAELKLDPTVPVEKLN